LLTRYQKDDDGKLVKKAVVYTEREHGIDPRCVDADAVRIVQRLRDNGHSAYIVGGAVRDLLLGRHPKDYDIATDAQPQRIKRIFYRSRIIGRRFRLVHVYVGERIYEVATFRSLANGSIGNTFGTIDEDALRRDFSVNALYFDPVEGLLVDYVNGLRDLRARKIVPVIPLAIIFSDDPVRMLRAVKYASMNGFRIPLAVRRAIWKNAGLLSTASVSRLGEEAVKILGSGRALPIIEGLARYRLLPAMLPSMATALAAGGGQAAALREALARMDAHVGADGDKTLGTLLGFLLEPVVRKAGELPAADATEAFRNALYAARDWLAPITMPRAEVEAAVKASFVEPVVDGKPRRRRPRRRRSGAGESGRKPVDPPAGGSPANPPA